MVRSFLLDVNVLLALAVDSHQHHNSVTRWFRSRNPLRWTICPLVECGFLRLATHPTVGARPLEEMRAWLVEMAAVPGFHFLPAAESWASLTAPFASRIFGHQQINDAYLLGLAVKEKSVLVTFDRGLKYLAGTEFAGHLLLLA